MGQSWESRSGVNSGGGVKEGVMVGVKVGVKVGDGHGQWGQGRGSWSGV